MSLSNELTRYFFTLGLLFIIPLLYLLIKRPQQSGSSGFRIFINGKAILFLLIVLFIGAAGFFGLRMIKQSSEPQECENYCHGINHDYFDYRPSKWYVLRGVCACYRKGTSIPNHAKEIKKK